MHIRLIDVYAVPYRHVEGEFAMSGGRVYAGQDATIVRLETDDGLVGWGEQCVIGLDYAQGHGPATRTVLEVLGQALLGVDPRRPEVAHAALAAAVVGYSEARSALDIACWDLCARAAGLRLCELLGGAYDDEVPLYTGVGLEAPARMAARCRAVRAAGFKRVQLKVGGVFREDVERIEACLDALGDADLVIADANAWWTELEAIRVARAVGRRDLVLEQPCRTLDACARVSSTTGLPVVLDESLRELDDLVRAYRLGAMHGARLKLGRLGGITPARRARDLAVALGVPVTVEDSGGGDIVSAALTHLAGSTPPRLLLAGYLPNTMVSERIARGAPAAMEGRARLPSGPGLGLEVETEALGQPVLRLGH